eukprot:PITA_31276
MEESKDLTKLQFDELVGSLMSHEERLKETFEAVEKAFSSKLQITKNEDASSSNIKIPQGQGKWQSQNYSKGRGRGGSSGTRSFRGRGRGRFDKRNVQCYHCNRYGHFERECRLKEGKNANYAQESGEYPRDHLFLSYAKCENTSKDVWYLDSGCSNHMKRNEKLFSAKDGSFKSKIQLGDDKSLELAAKGSMEVQTKEGIKSIHDIYYTPQLKHVECWAAMYGHLNFKSLKFLTSHALVSGLPKVEEHKEVCEGCAKGKNARERFPKGSAWRAHHPLQLVHLDICGPMQTWSLALDTFKKFKALVENERGCKIKCLRTDHGGELCSKAFQSYCDMNGMRMQHTTTYTPEQNGIAERKIRTVVKMERCMLQTKGLRKSYWGDAVATSVYILNRSPTSALENMTPYEAWYGKKPNVNHFKVFGCLAYAHIPNQNRKKLDAKSELCIFIGYSETRKAYNLYNPLTNKLIVSTDVIFYEGGVYGHQKGHVEKTKYVLNDDIVVDNDHEQPTNVSVTSGLTPPRSPSSISSTSSSSPTSSPSSTRKVRILSDIYERSANQAHEERSLGEIVNFALLAKAEFEPSCFEDACTNEV